MSRPISENKLTNPARMSPSIIARLRCEEMVIFQDGIFIQTYKRKSELQKKTKELT